MQTFRSTILSCFSVCLAGIGLYCLFASLAYFFPLKKVDYHQLKKLQLGYASTVYDRNDQQIGEFYLQRRYFVPVKEVPIHTVRAFLSAEDNRFFSHSGVSLPDIIRAAWMNITRGHIVQGGSTLTQQLVKMHFLSKERSFTRKLKEVSLALQLEQYFSKEEILELYFNSIYLGGGNYGIEAASRFYFGKTTSELSLSESTLLAALPKAPSSLALHKNLKGAQERQHKILQAMLKNGYISSYEFENGKQENPTIQKARVETLGFVQDRVVKYLKHQSLENLRQHKGDRVSVTVSQPLQHSMQNLLSQLESYGFNKKVQASLVVLNSDGEILSELGSSGYRLSQFNRARYSMREVETVLYPFVALYALEQGYSSKKVAQLMFDHQEKASSWQGFGRELGLPLVKELLGKVSIDSHIHPSGELLGKSSLMQMIAGLNSLHSGRWVKPWLIKQHNHRVFDHNPGPSVVSIETAYSFKYLVEHSFPILGIDSLLHNGWVFGFHADTTFGVWIGSEFGKEKIAASENDAKQGFMNLQRDIKRVLQSVYNPRPQKLPPKLSFRVLRLGDQRQIFPFFPYSEMVDRGRSL